MLKIKKGTKKKSKGKKDKEDDLFDPVNLAKYKKELEESKREASGSTSTAKESQDLGPHEEDEEWKRFKLLTQGIDVTLKKTSGDLDRIKTSSYFQRQVPATVVEEKKEQWENVEQEGNHFHQEPFGNISKSDDPVWGDPQTLPEKKHELKFDQVEKEVIILDDGLFDTSYLDGIESGEIQLAYIPESPTEDVSGDDPFDTSGVADVIKKIQEEEVKEKRKVNLGLAVDFLTKNSEVPIIPSTTHSHYTDKTAELNKVKRGRPVHVDLLGFDTEEDDFSGNQRINTIKPIKVSEQKTLEESDLKLKDLLLEFETNPQNFSANQKIVSNFDLLVEPEIIIDELSQKEDEDDIWFRTDDDTTEKIETVDESIDPFDTTVVEKLGFGKSELRQLENELLPREIVDSTSNIFNPSSTITNPVTENVEEEFLTKVDFNLDEDFDFNPRKYEESESIFNPLDIVSEFDIAALSPQQTFFNSEDLEIDPFDTSNVSHIIIPGKSELRLLEDEFRNDNTDFTESVSTSRYLDQNSCLLSNPLEALDDCISDILELNPPLTTQLTRTSTTNQFEDPFDTSDVVDTFTPGKAELKELESQLLNSSEDFVPIRICPLRNFRVLQSTVSITSKAPERQESEHPFDSIDTDCELEHHRPLSPHLTSSDNSFVDPFDTSSVTTTILPGKIEAKLLEEELAAASFHPIFTHTTVERTQNTFSLPPNNSSSSQDFPVTFPIQNFEEEEVDPFDTSIAESFIS